MSALQTLPSRLDDEAMLISISARLALRFPSCPRSTIENMVREEYQTLAVARIRAYIAPLTEHQVRTRLRSLSRRD
jgi:hypothetical protein